MKRVKRFYAVCMGTAILGSSAWAQAAGPVTLKVDLENVVGYWDDGVDFSRLGSVTGVTTPVATRRIFQSQVQIGDIVAVNGVAAKGTFITNARNLNVTTAVAPGQSIADTTRTGIAQYTFEFLQFDGTPIGTIFVSALNGGTPSPGAPTGTAQVNGVIVGGTGAFWGAQGQVASTAPNPAVRFASFSEDTASRRINGGGKVEFSLQLIVPERPQVIATANGPAIIHAGNSQFVTAANPAHAGETLVLFATGLGPVRSAIDMGQPFPYSPLALVNSPVSITVNGAPASVLYAGGYPGAVDGYQVNFTLPASLAPGTATLQLSTAWIPGGAVQLPVQ
jgi:uncharacterized protein (TIGR03437 family)